MKISLNDKEIYTLLPWEVKLLENDIPSEARESDCQRRLEWVLKHKVDRCWERFEKEWMEKLRNDPTVKSIPVSKEDFVNLVTSRSDYKNRSQRDQLT